MKTQESFTKYQRAKIRVDKIKGFYSHLGIFVFINAVILYFKIGDRLDSWASFTEAFFTLEALSTLIIWGTILGLHALSVFVFPSFMGYEWEQKKIKEFMDEELKLKQNSHGKI